MSGRIGSGFGWILPLLAAGIGVAACGEGRGEPVPPAEPTAPAALAEPVRSWPHDPTAFTQGLVWEGGELFEGTGRYGESSLRRVALETGEVLQKVDLPDRFFGEGIAVRGDSIFQLTWTDRVGFVYDRRSLEQIGTFEYRTEGWGLTSGDEALIMSDGSSYLQFLDPRTFQLVRELQVTDGGVPVNQLNELEWVRGEIWANVWHSDSIARVDPQSGRVKGWVDLSALYPAAQRPEEEAVLNGIAYDPGEDRLFVTGKLWPRLFEIRVPSLGIGGGR